MSRLALGVMVSISGASVLALEILGTRILGPFYGVSLFLWSALITVTLVSLSVGYGVGGRWADRGPTAFRLGILLAGAGAWCLLIPWLRGPVLSLTEPLGLRTALLTAAFLLFAPPLALLGMVSPYAVRLQARSLGEVGRTAGDLNALSTLAGVAAALATGFWLIPYVGVARLTRMTGALLLLGAALAFWTSRAQAGRRRISILLPLALVAMGWGVVGSHGSGPSTPESSAESSAEESSGPGSFPAALPEASARERPALLDRRDSPYSEVRVVEAEGIRYLLLDGSIHTMSTADEFRSLFPHVPVMESARLLFDAPGSALVVGLGGGSLAKDLSAAGWKVDAVEIDPVVVRMAESRFGLLPSEARVSVEDGRAFLERKGRAYDLILLDAFGAASIPFHLATEEFFALAASRLASGGVLAANVEAVGWNDPLIGALARTLGTCFREVLALPATEPPNVLGNIVLLAANRSLQIDEDRLGRPFLYLADPPAHWVVMQRNHAWNNRYRPDISHSPVLTDDRNQVDVLGERVNREARRKLHRLPALAGMLW